MWNACPSWEQKYFKNPPFADRSALVGDLHVEDAILLEIVGNGVLGKQRCAQLNLGANPFPICVCGIWPMFALAARAEFGTEGCANDFIELLQVAEGLVTHRARNINFQVDGGHAAGLVVRRLTITKARPNMKSENSRSVAIAEKRVTSPVLLG